MTTENMEVEPVFLLFLLVPFLDNFEQYVSN